MSMTKKKNGNETYGGWAFEVPAGTDAIDAQKKLTKVKGVTNVFTQTIEGDKDYVGIFVDGDKAAISRARRLLKRNLWIG